MAGLSIFMLKIKQLLMQIFSTVVCKVARFQKVQKDIFGHRQLQKSPYSQKKLMAKFSMKVRQKKSNWFFIVIKYYRFCINFAKTALIENIFFKIQKSYSGKPLMFKKGLMSTLVGWQYPSCVLIKYVSGE